MCIEQKQLVSNTTHSNSPKFLNDLDVSQVDVCVLGGVNDTQDGVDTDWRQDTRVLRHHLTAALNK